MSKFNPDATAKLQELLTDIYKDSKPKIHADLVDNIKQFVAEGADPNITLENRYQYDQSLLSLTRLTNNHTILKEILELPNLKLERPLDSDGNNILHLYCKIHDGAMSVRHLEVIINNPNIKINLNCQNYEGHTPLYLTFIYGMLETSFGLLMQNPKIELNYKNAGKNLLHLAAAGSISNDCLNKLAALACNQKIDINAQDNAGYTALHLACRSNESRYIQCLLKNNARQDIKDYKGNYPYEYTENKEILAMFLKSDGSIENLKAGIDACIKAFVKDSVGDHTEDLHNMFVEIEQEYKVSMSGEASYNQDS